MMKQYWFIPIKWQNFYIGKDVCQIPLQIKNSFGYDTYLIFIGKYFDEEKIINNYNGIKIVILNNYLEMIILLIKNFRNINLFGTFHFHRISLFLIFLFKIFNKNGKVILKSDISYNSIIQLLSFRKNFLKNIIIKYLLDKINIFTVESKKNLFLLKENFFLFKNKFVYVSNGFNSINVPIIDFLNRENNIVVIGHIGDKNKNHKLLIDSLKNIKIKSNWNIIFIGKVINNFDKYVLSKTINPNIKFIFTGPIYNKNKLYNLLNKSKIFCHTSNFEGDPLVQYEAMYYGLYCVSTDCGTIKNNYPDFFSKISKIGDINEYTRNLQFVINYFEKGNNSKIKSNALECHKYCEKNFLWSKTTLYLLKKIKLGK